MAHRTSCYQLRGGSLLATGKTECWSAHCECGQWTGDFDTEKEALAACEDHKRKERNARARASRKAHEEAMRDAGLKKVRGARGGTHWE